MKQLINRIVIFILCISLFTNCEDVIDVSLKEGDVSLVVDAWVNNKNEDQVIQLNLSQPYFDSSIPTTVSDAKVIITRDDGQEFDFEYQGDGFYKWIANSDSLGSAGSSYILEIKIENKIYAGQSEMHRVPKIDSIGIELRENEFFFDDGLYAQFYARDYIGKGDSYWIKTYRNGEFLNKSQEINIAYDAGFDAGTGIDGLIFIPPIRELINPLNEDLLASPYDPGDQLRVEIHSISNGAFNFMELVRDQINNGDNGIFSIPLANTGTNIMAQDGSVVLGYFNVAAISSATTIIEE